MGHTIMTTNDNPVTNLIFTEKTFNKNKEDFVWFIKTAIADKKSDAYGELFHRLLKIFVYADDAEKEASLLKMFNEMDLKYTGVISFDEWLTFCLQHIGAKVATLEAHPILDHGNKEEFKTFVTKAVVPGSPEHTELFWYLLEIFLAHDSNKDGNVTEYAFATMVDKVLMLPLKLKMVKTDEQFFGEDIAKKDQIRKEQFTKYNTRGDGKMSFDEFLAYCLDNIFKKMLLDD